MKYLMTFLAFFYVCSHQAMASDGAREKLDARHNAINEVGSLIEQHKNDNQYLYRANNIPVMLVQFTGAALKYLKAQDQTSQGASIALNADDKEALGMCVRAARFHTIYQMGVRTQQSDVSSKDLDFKWSLLKQFPLNKFHDLNQSSVSACHKAMLVDYCFEAYDVMYGWLAKNTFYQAGWDRLGWYPIDLDNEQLGLLQSEL